MAEKRERIIFEAVSDFRGVITDLSTIKRLQQDLLEATKAQTASIVDANNSQKKSFEQLITANQDLAKSIKGQTDSYKSHQQTVRDTNNEYQALKSTMTGLVGLAASIFTISQAKSFINDIIEAKSKVDNFRNTLLSMGDSVASLDAVTAGIQRLDKNSGYTSEQLYKTATALKANSVPTVDLIDKLTMLGNISALVGETKLPLIAKAYLDVRNKQILYAQEVRQFTENGVPLYDLLAKSMDKPKQAVIEMAKAHEISFAQVEKALREATEKGGIYYGAMETKAKSLQGQVSNLSASFFYGQKNLADYFENGLQKGINVIRDFIDVSLGSDKAIGRTISYITSATALWISYKVAQITATSAMKANQVQSLVSLGTMELEDIAKKQRIANLIAEVTADATLTAELKASQIARLTNIQSLIVENEVKVVGAGVTTSLATATRGLWLAMASNPIGFLVAGIGLLVSGMMAYKAMSGEVVEVNNQEITAIRKLKIGYDAQLSAIANTTIGTEKRREEVAKMQRLYPEYIGNINLETASTAQLKSQLSLVNTLFERKIKLASVNAQVETITNQAVEIENRRADIIRKLRDGNVELSNKYMRDANFIIALKSEQAKQEIDGINSYQKNMNGLAIGVYNNLGVEAKKVFKDIEKASLDASFAQKRDAQVTYHFELLNLQGQLDRGLISRKEYNVLVADANAKLRGEEVKKESDTENIILGDKKRKRALSAKEVNVIEAEQADQSLLNQKTLLNAQYELAVDNANKKYAKDKDGAIKAEAEIAQLAKTHNAKIAVIDAELLKNKKLTAKEITLIALTEGEQTIENQKKILKLQLQIDADSIALKYKNQKDGKIKAEEEILNLVKIYNQKVQVIEASEQRKKDIIEERRRLSEADQVSKDLVQFEKDEKKKTDKAEKVLTEWETKQEKLLSTYDEARKKKEDAQRVYDEVNTAKTATEKYNVVVKYGRKTSDEISTINVSRWKKEEDALKKQLQFYFHTYGEDSKEYKKTYEALLTLRTKILNAESTLLEKQMNEQLNRWSKTYDYYKKHLSDTFEIAEKTFTDIQSVYQKSMDFQLKSLDDTYQRQYKFLGDDYTARLALTEEFSNKQVELLTNKANQDKIFTTLIAVTKATQEGFEQQNKLNESYQNGTITAYQKTAGTVANIVNMSAGIVSQVLTSSYTNELAIIDAKQKSNEKYYEDSVNLAKQAYDAKIKLIENEETAHKDAIDRELATELKKIDILQRLSINANDKVARKALEDLITNKNNELKINEDAKAEELKGAEFQYNALKDMDMGKNQFIELERMGALSKLANAKATEIEIAESTGASIFDIEEKYRALNDATNAEYDAKQDANLTLRQGQQSTAKEDFEARKAEIEERYEKKKQDILDKAEKDKQDILDKSEKRKGDIIANAEIAKTMAVAQNEEKRTKIVQDALDAKLLAQYEYDTLEYEAKKKLNIQQGELEVQRLEAERGMKKAQIAMALAVAAAQLFAINPILGIVGAIAAVGTGAVLFDQIDNATGAAQHQVNLQIENSKNAPPPVEPVKSKPVIYIRTNEQNAQSGGLAQFDEAGAQLYNNPDGMVDFNQNPQGANNHESPIDYINWQGAKLGVYGWNDVERGGVIYKVPDLFRKYFQGSDYIERGIFPQGKDTIPAMVNEGERIVPTEQNEEIGGANLSNTQMVEMVKIGKIVQKGFPTLAELMLNSKGNLPVMNWGGNSTMKDERLLNELQKLNGTVQKIKPTILNVKADRDSITIEEQLGNMTTRYRNQLYRN